MEIIDSRTALKIGRFVPTTGRALLQSVHRDVINLEQQDELGAFFVSLVRRKWDFTELGVLLSHRVWEEVHDTLPPVDTEMVYTFVLQKNSELLTTSEIKFPVAENYSLENQLITPKELAGHVATRFCIPAQYHNRGLLSVAEIIQPSGGQSLADPFIRRTEEVLKRIYETHADQLDLSPLVGLGIGFTPAGDDFIAGAYLMERLLTNLVLPDSKRYTEKTHRAGPHENGTPTRFKPIDSVALWNHLGKTTTGGATLLRLVLNDAPPAYLAAMGYALIHGDGPCAARIAEDHGHTSGFDALAGMIWRVGTFIGDTT